MRLSSDQAWILRRFLELYYEGPGGGGRPFESARWMGVPALKCPLDLWIYQELLFERRPGLIVETGTRYGGTTLYLAHMCDLLGHGRIVSIDTEDLQRPRHDRITYLLGSSTDKTIVSQVEAMKPTDGGILVILDSDHRRQHVEAELELYAPLLGTGDYLIVEDTNINGHPVLPGYGPGPHEAVQAFLAQHGDFKRDRAREKFLLTFNPGGFLKRVEISGAVNVDAASRDLVADAGDDPYQPDAEREASFEQTCQAREAATAQARLAEVTPAFTEAMRQLVAAQDVGAHFRDAVAALAEAAEREQRLSAQLADTTAAFQEAMRQLDVSRNVGDGLHDAVRLLEQSAEREGRLNAQLEEVTRGFAEAMRQLEQGRVVGDGFRQAVAMLEQAAGREADLAERVLILEEELRRAQIKEAADRRDLASTESDSPGQDQSRSSK